MAVQTGAPSPPRSGLLSAIERGCNALPDLSFLYLGGIFVLIGLSALGDAIGWSALHPSQTDDQGNPVELAVISLLSADMVGRLLIEMPRIVAEFRPLGYLLTAIVGLAVAEQSGMLSALTRAWLLRLPKAVLSLLVIGTGALANIAADWSYVILLPLAGMLFAAAGRHPLAGVFAGFAGVAAASSANLIAPTQLDMLVFGITESAAELIDPSWNANALGNWYFTSACWLSFTIVGWLITDWIVEPRLGNTVPAATGQPSRQLTPTERKGMSAAGQSFMVFITALTALVVWQRGAVESLSESSLAAALMGITMIGLVSCGIAFGVTAGSIRNSGDVVAMITQGFRDFAPTFVVLFVFALFFAMMNWSNLLMVATVAVANQVASLQLSGAGLVFVLPIVALLLNIMVGSASAKWVLLAPLFVPLLMSAGVSPEMATAAYRLGDGVTNPISPFGVYFPITLAFCRKWIADAGLGTLLAGMLPYSAAFLGVGLALLGLWLWLGLPLGPGSPALYAPGVAPP